MAQKIIELKAGVELIKNGIAKFINIQENFPEENFSSSEFMQLYTCIYTMCIQNQEPPHSYEQELFDLYGKSVEGYVKGTVLPSLRGKHDEFFLSELLKRWKKYKVIVGWMLRLFNYLDRFFIPNSRRSRPYMLRPVSLPSLNEVAFTCFYNAVSQDINMKARDIIISLIEQEREGAQIDRVLLKNCMDYFVEVGAGAGDYYQKHYEQVILDSTASYYLGKAMSSISEENYSDRYYIEKARECLTREEGNVSHYLAFCSKDKLLATVQQQLLSVYEKHQHDKDKLEDISRNLFSLRV